MSSVKLVDSHEAVELMESGAIVADIRDPGSFASAHIKGAVALSNDNLQDFLDATEFDQPIIVCCYHGISSQSAAAFLIERGYESVYSLNGGFESWSLGMPDKVESA